MNIKYTEMPDFRRSLIDMFNQGGQNKKKAEKVYALLGRMSDEFDILKAYRYSLLSISTF
jgi:hypothetical protein